MRPRRDRGILAIGEEPTRQEGDVAVEIHLWVTRGEGDRLDGSARVSGGSEIREFSGVLELMRVFEELVPSEHAPGTTAVPSRPDS